MGFTGQYNEPESVIEVVEICEYDAEGKLIKRTTTTTTRTTKRKQSWGPIYGSTTGHAVQADQLF